MLCLRLIVEKYVCLAHFGTKWVFDGFNGDGRKRNALVDGWVRATWPREVRNLAQADPMHFGWVHKVRIELVQAAVEGGSGLVWARGLALLVAFRTLQDARFMRRTARR
ncbi:hypothetical protein AK812_SmicGene45728, partial [Symbiodinium microadriaticum]